MGKKTAETAAPARVDKHKDQLKQVNAQLKKLGAMKSVQLYIKAAKLKGKLQTKVNAAKPALTGDRYDDMTSMGDAITGKVQAYKAAVAKAGYNVVEYNAADFDTDAELVLFKTGENTLGVQITTSTKPRFSVHVWNAKGGSLRNWGLRSTIEQALKDVPAALKQAAKDGLDFKAATNAGSAGDWKSDPRAEEMGPADEFARRISAATGVKVTPLDYLEWMEPQGNGDAAKFEKAARKLVGDTAYEAGENMARAEDLIGFALKIPNYSEKVGGISMSKILRAKSVPKTKPRPLPETSDQDIKRRQSEASIKARFSKVKSKLDNVVPKADIKRHYNDVIAELILEKTSPNHQYVYMAGSISGAIGAIYLDAKSKMWYGFMGMTDNPVGVEADPKRAAVCVSLDFTG